VLAIAIVMIVILVVAGLVLAYVAYPHRGEEMPKAPWLGEVMERAVEAAPLLDPTDEHHEESSWLSDEDVTAGERPPR